MNKDFLKKLLAVKTPSGYEGNAKDVIIDEMKKADVPYAYVFDDAVGNLCLSIEPRYANSHTFDGENTIMLSGHIDEIALQVQNIDDKGFIHFIKDGGIDPKVILGTTVTILTQTGEVKGVIGKQPIHVEWHDKDKKDKVTEIKDMKIDVGAESKDEVLSMGICVGDPITIDDIPLELGKNRFCGRGLDDKVGVFVAFEAMKKLAEIGLHNTKVYAVACTQEETSASGAVSATVKIDPKYSIDYDVTFATDYDYVSPNEWGDIKLGKGGAIAYGPDSNMKFAKLVKGVCEDKKIPYQEFSLGSGGTDTVYIKQSSTNANTLLLSIPNRNMHTQVEVCDYRDIQSLIDMTVETVLKIDKEN
jgi:endoglucanase